MHSNGHLVKHYKDPSRKEDEQTLYRSMMSNLLYLTTSRLGISFNVGICTRFQACPKESYYCSKKDQV